MADGDFIIRNENCSSLIMSEDTLDIMLPIEADLDRILRDKELSCVRYLQNKYLIIYTYSSNLLNQELIERYYRSAPKCYGLLDTYNLEEMGVTRLRRQPYIDLYGNGTLIGFVDTGIDFTNPLFRNGDGTTRIHSLWDQNINVDGQLCYMGYGKEYTKADINEALLSDDPLSKIPSYDEYNHGNFMAAVAAGNDDPDNNFSGIATNAELVVVKLKPAKRTARRYFLIGEDVTCFQENDIALGVRYLVDVARELRKPIAICIGLGTAEGGHDGNNILGDYLNDVAHITGSCVVVAAGNEAGNRGHYESLGDKALGTYEDVELRVGEGEVGFNIELWASPPQLYSIELISPGGEYFRPRFTRVDSRDFADFIFEGTVVHVSTYIQEPKSGDFLIFMRFYQPVPGIWTIRVVNEEVGNISFNMWLPLKQFLNSDTYFLRSSPYITITEPGNTQFPITVAAYNHVTKSIYINSGRGYTRSGRIKPDISAPGVNIYGPSDEDDDEFTRKTGTSVAAAEATGIAALLLEWGIVEKNRPFMDTTEIKTLMIRGAKKSDIVYPNREWGYGMIDIYGVFENLRRTV